LSAAGLFIRLALESFPVEGTSRRAFLDQSSSARRAAFAHSEGKRYDLRRVVRVTIELATQNDTNTTIANMRPTTTKPTSPIISVDLLASRLPKTSVLFSVRCAIWDGNLR